MKAIILAAGRGIRMGHLTEDKPKCLVELKSVTLLERQLMAIRSAGILEIGIVTGYKRELLHINAVREFFNPRWHETNMVYSLSMAQDWLESDNCIVSYSDIFYDPSAIESLINSAADVAVTYDAEWLKIWSRRFQDPLSDAETFRVASDGLVTEIGGCPASLSDVQGQYMGLLRFSPTGWRAFSRAWHDPTNQRPEQMHMTSTLQRLIELKYAPVFGVPYSGEWGEVDSKEDLAAY